MVSMLLLCWNLGAAAGRWRKDEALHDRAWHWIAALDPDLALLQETRAPAWVGERWNVLAGPFLYFASAVVARAALQPREVALPSGGALERFGSYLATAEVALAGGAALVVSSVHTAAREAQTWGYPELDGDAIARRSVGVPWWNDVAYAAFRRYLGERRFLVGGDWNTSRWVDAQGVPSPAGAEFFDRAAADGWVDVSLDATGREGRSWYGSDNPRPHQPDHVFADRETAARVRSFEIEPWPITNLGLSDHAPLLVELDIDLEVTVGPRGEESASA
jgi:endonuclease/exonuclease/phosphatase family metal-dependent hydrolase